MKTICISSYSLVLFAIYSLVCFLMWLMPYIFHRDSLLVWRLQSLAMD
jgi:hypothetical protein